MLAGRKIALGVSGGIAAYKAAEIVSSLRRQGAEVTVAMTREATRFVSPLTFRTLSGNPVIVEMFDEPRRWNVEHVALAEWADLFVVAPATANVIGKIACGIADDFLSTAVMAASSRVLLAPAMNSRMWLNPIVQANVSRLRALGYEFVGPEEGHLACGSSGPGRMAEPATIVAAIERFFTKGRDLEGVRVLVTAGPTREHIDPVRFISNPSSGKMGFAIAEEALSRGAQVTLVSGPVALEAPAGVKTVRVTTAVEMYRAVLDEFDAADVVIKAAAVSDYRPAETRGQKIKKEAGDLAVRLVRNPDILEELGRRKGSKVLVGFAAETNDIVENAIAKIRKKNLDLIVVNDVTQAGAGFESDTNAAKIIDGDGSVLDVPLTSKRDLAAVILDRVSEILKARKS